MLSKQKIKVIIVAGPCGVGKTTIADLLSKAPNIKLITGDQLKQSLFPEIVDITEHPEKLKIIKALIFKQSKKYFYAGKSVVIDYVVLGKNYIQQYQNEFKENLLFKVIFPPKHIIYQRDRERKCWTSGKKCIDELYDKYIDLIDLIGKENYINNENQTPEETIKTIKCLTSEYSVN